MTNKPVEPILTRNVSDFERGASVLGGLLLVGKGLRRGGVGGFLRLAIGSVALLRGYTGHCEAKRLYNELREKQKAAVDQRYSHMPMDSEVHSPDFESANVTLPDATPMGHEHSSAARSPTSSKPANS